MTPSEVDQLRLVRDRLVEVRETLMFGLQDLSGDDPPSDPFPASVWYVVDDAIDYVTHAILRLNALLPSENS